MLLAGSAVAMSLSCSKKDDPAKTWDCTCNAPNPEAARTNQTEAQKNALLQSSCNSTSSTLAKNTGTWTCL